MGVQSVIATFVMCILFNLLLPTGDVGSDIKLMIKTLTFDLAHSLEMEGCKSCFHKSEKDVYYPEENLSGNECKTCVLNRKLYCAMFPIFLKKMREFSAEKEICFENETLRLTSQHKLGFGECDYVNDVCCITKSQTIKIDNPIQKLDPKKVIYPCGEYTKELDYCLVLGSESATDCFVFKTTNRTVELLELDYQFTSHSFTNQFYQQLLKRKINVEAFSTNENILFYPFSLINQSWVIEEKNHSITDPEIKCGILFLKHYNNKLQQPYGPSYDHYCDEDSCLTHLKSLRTGTSISDLSEWKKRADNFHGRKVGGVICYVLQIYGWSILIPILLNLGFHIVLFSNDFHDKEANIFEIIPLMLLVYPQYKTIKFLCEYLFVHRNEEVLNYEKEKNNREVASLEPFLESCLQVGECLV